MPDQKNEVNAIPFFRSFFEAGEELPDDARLRLYDAILRYGFCGREPDFQGIEKAVFIGIKPNIDASLKSIENGKKGGAPKGNQNAKKDTEKNNQNKGGCFNKTSNKDKDKDMDMELDNTLCSPAANCGSKNNGTHNAEMRGVDVTAERVFERLWELYPLKRGKSKVSKANKRRLLDIGLDETQRAVERYKADLAKETWRKPQNGSTFFNGGYVDYLDANYTAPPWERKDGEGGNLNDASRSYRPLPGVTEL